ncbi:hypothetical protein AMTR_s00081p00020790 [Amborella trichopoda]|uniref:Uncharacterized protein n=1 Tax=Amborella trichopoda TaxID=13333 RepID=W1P3M1_AMBTC|nr:hypothetical protein AMTR_s00081p00020790 [Amborella trichopoda]
MDRLLIQYLELDSTTGFEWQKIVEDWDDWMKWISSRGGIGVPATKNWESWWDDDQEHLQYTGFMGLTLGDSPFTWLLPLTSVWSVLARYSFSDVHLKGRYLLVIVLVLSMGKKFSADFQLMFRLLKLFLFIGSVGTLGVLFSLR